jgi:4-amino-4-deoxy-L-arabinose transferase-like glycosyltransferase
MHSEAGQYRGFFWNYFINEQVLRFLNRRYPRDYNTVPRLLFWLETLAWLFPWIVYLPAAMKQSLSTESRAGRVRLMALCWIAFVMFFFTFSTTQEYYSMPIYPALALLIGSAIAEGGKAIRVGTRVAASIATVALIVIAGILAVVWNAPVPGDIAGALTQNPDAYTLSLGHMQDLTLKAFAYFRAPLCVAAVALFVGAAGGWLLKNGRALAAIAAMMVIFFQATRQALIVMEPVLSSRSIANALVRSPHGGLIVADEYYTFSSVFFYANRKALLTKRVNNLEYGSNAPGAPKVFIGEEEIADLWQSRDRQYLVVVEKELPGIEKLVGKDRLYLVKQTADRYLFSNRPLDEL